MTRSSTEMAPRTDCKACPLRKMPHFRPFQPAELDFVSRFKTGELTADAGASLLVEGAHSAHLYTVLKGWGFRYKLLPDGRRQILSYVMPGNLVGLQGSLMGEMQHSVEALTPITLCVFERDRLSELFKNYPALGYDMTWIAARSERVLDETLLSVGQRSAIERSAYLLAVLAHRARTLGLASGTKPVPLPLTQTHVADTLGLSVVHTNKTLKRLSSRNLIRWRDRGCDVLDIAGLATIAGWEQADDTDQPFI